MVFLFYIFLYFPVISYFLATFVTPVLLDIFNTTPIFIDTLKQYNTIILQYYRVTIFVTPLNKKPLLIKVEVDLFNLVNIWLTFGI